MKRVGGLFDRIVRRDTLGLASWRAGRGKRQRTEVVRFYARLDEELTSIAHQVAYGNYGFASYRCFAVRDTKTRTIHAPPFRDRVVHHAVIAATGAAFETGALFHSYACRRRKGQHAALRQAKAWTRRAHWYGKMDVRKFYDSVDHATLRRLLARRFRERRLLGLFDALLDSYETTPGKGLPIGALTSQYLANFYLDEFDRRMKATGLAKRYLRYMDDSVVWGNRDALSDVRSIAVDVLGSLHLELKDAGQWNSCERGLPFLGFVIYPDRVRLGRQARKRLGRKVRGLERAWRRSEISENDLQSRGTALFAHASFGDDRRWRQAMLARGQFDDE